MGPGTRAATASRRIFLNDRHRDVARNAQPIARCSLEQTWLNFILFPILYLIKSIAKHKPSQEVSKSRQSRLRRCPPSPPQTSSLRSNSFLTIVPSELAKGNIVELGDFGSFWLKTNTEGADTAEEVRSDQINTVLPRFNTGSCAPDTCVSSLQLGDCFRLAPEAMTLIRPMRKKHLEVFGKTFRSFSRNPSGTFRDKKGARRNRFALSFRDFDIKQFPLSFLTGDVISEAHSQFASHYVASCQDS